MRNSEWFRRELDLGTTDLFEECSNPRAANVFEAALDWTEKHKGKWICTSYGHWQHEVSPGVWV